MKETAQVKYPTQASLCINTARASEMVAWENKAMLTAILAGTSFRWEWDRRPTPGVRG